MKTKLHIRRLFYLFSFIFYLLSTPSECLAASCTSTADWGTGWCSICGGPNGNYACDPPWSGSGDFVCKNIGNCVPAGNIVTGISITLWHVPFCVSAPGTLQFNINGTVIGSASSCCSCPCGGCTTSTYNNTWSCPSGMPGWNYGGGPNNLCPVVTSGDGICIDRAVITVTYTPTAPPVPCAISGPVNPCVGSTQVYSTCIVSGATSYTWTLPAGWTGSSSTNSISVTVGSSSGQVCVRANNACGSSAYTCLSVSPLSGPAAPGAITGPGTPCANTTQTYSTTGTTPFTWTVPGGWTINFGQGTSSINVTVGTSDGDVCVRSCNACACSAFTCRFIDVQLPPGTPSAISGPLTPCAGTTQTYSVPPVPGATSYQWTLPAGWTGTSITNTITVTVGSSSGNVCVRAGNGCGFGPFQCLFVTPGSVPATPGAISGPSPVCAGSTQIYSISAVPNTTGYNWTVPGGWTITGGQNTTSITVTVGSSTGSVCVQACNSCGCSASSCRTITVSNVTLAMSSTPESCGGACNGSVTATPSGGTSPYNYSWSNGCTTQSCSPLCPGTYTVTVTDAIGCSAMGSATVSAGAPVLAGFTYNGNQCPGNSFNFTNTGTMGVTYSWTFPSGTPSTSTAENPSGITWSTPGTYTITQTVTNGLCSATATLTITVYSQPSVTVTGTNVLCFGACNGTANATVSQGQSPYNYSWSPAPGGGQGTPNVTGLCPNTYTVTVTDANGCVGMGTITITQPGAALTSTTNSPVALLCNGDCNGVATVTPAGGTIPYTYAWDGGTGFQTTQSATGLCVGIYNVDVTDANGCITMNAVTVTQPSAMALTMSSTNATCGLSDGSVTVSVLGGTIPYTYLWNNGCTTPVCAGVPAGPYTVTVTDANGCTAMGAVTVNTTAAVFVDSTEVTSNYNGSQVSCVGSCDGTAEVYPSGGLLPYAYAWNTSPVQTNSVATGLCAGTYSVTVTDANNCQAGGSVTLVNPPALSAAITASTQPLCNGDCNGNATVTASGGTGAYTYSWTPVGGTGATSSSVFCAGTPYTATVTDANGCTAAASVTLTQPATLTITSIVGTNVSCNGGSNGAADLTVTGGTPAYTYSWTGPGGFTSTAQDIINISAGTYNVTVTDANGCNTMGSVTIIEPTPITLTTNTTDAYCSLPNGGACVVASGGTPGPGYTYLWSGPGSQTTACATGLPGVVTYNVTVTDNNGCTATSVATVNNLPPFTVTIALNNNVSGFGLCDGRATANPSGGFSPYTYLWNDLWAQTTQQADSLCAGNHCVTVTDSAGCVVANTCIVITEPPAIWDTIVGTNILCNGDCNGAADLTVTGGVSPYTYSWTGPGGFTATTQDIIGLCAGTYVIVITDNNGITRTDAIVISQPPVLGVTIAGTNLICNGVCTGSAAATATGGVTPYTYLWSNSQTTSTATGLCAGTYNLTVTDSNGCVTMNSVTLTEPLPVIVSTTVTNATCGQSDGTATANVTNGVTPYTYSWNSTPVQTTQTATGIPGGTYTVTVTDATGCIGTAQAGVGDDAGPASSITDSTNVSCFGACNGTATVTVTGGTPPYTYSWVPTAQTTPTALGLCAGTHTVQIVDGTGCMTAVSVTITEPNILAASTQVLTSPLCNGNCNGVAQVTVTGGTAPYAYQWNDPGTQTTPTPTGLCAGTYNVVVTDANGCIANSSVTITEPAPLVLSVTTVNVTCNGLCNGSASVTATGGTPPYSYSWSTTPVQTGQTATGLCAGTLFITVTDGNGCNSVSTVIITQPPPLIVSISNFGNVDCNGNCNGFATLGQTGGTPPYSYAWSDGQNNQTAINLCPATYIGVITDINGCKDSATVTITQPNALTVTMASTNVSCFGACNGTATVTVSGGQPPYTYQWDDPFFQTTSTATGLCADSSGPELYSPTIFDANGCSITANVLIFQPQQLSINVSSVTSSNCGNADGGACISVSGGSIPYTYQWNDPNNTTVNCIDSVVAGVYQITVIDFKFCFTSLLIAINDITGPVIDSILTVDDNCYGDSIGTATGYATPSISTLTCIWKNGAGDTLNQTPPPYIGEGAVDSLGAGSYSLTVIDPGTGCVTSQVFAIGKPSPLNSAIFAFPPFTVNASCNGVCDGQAQVSVSGGTPPYAYQWNNLQTTATATGLCVGSYTVTVTDSILCSSVSAVNITEPAPLLVNPLVADVSCFGDNDGGIGANESGGTGPYVYQWGPPGTGGNVDTVTNLVAGIYIVTVSDAKGCTASDSNIVVSEPTLMVVTDSVIPATCAGANGIATVTPTGGTPGYFYLWNDNPPPFQTDSTATGLLEGSYVVIVTDNNGCTQNIPVFVPGTPTPVIDSVVASDFNGSNIDCYGNSTGTATAFVSSGILPYTYSWNTSPSQDSVTATGLTAGIYIVEVRDSNNCLDIEVTTLSQPDSLMLLTFGDALKCFGDSALISVAYFGGTNPFVRGWCCGLPDTSQYWVLADTTDCSQQVNPPPPPCKKVYTVVVTDKNNCAATDSVVINVNYPLLVAKTEAEICEGETATISVIASYGNGGPYEYEWLTGNPADTTSSLTVTPASTTIYPVVTRDNCSPNDTTYVLVVVNKLPQINFFSDKNTGCTIMFTDTSKGYSPSEPIDSLLPGENIASWFWNFGDGTLMGPDSGAVTGVPNTSGTYNNPVHFYETPGTYSVTVTVTDINGCSSTLTYNSMITYVAPTADFTPVPSITTTANTVIQFTDISTSPNGNIVSWSWDFADGNTDTVNQNPVHTYAQDSAKTYSVMLISTDADGCIDTVWKTVTIEQEPVIYVPNVFSPDKKLGDDKLYVCGQKVESLFFVIYDRWGKKIWEYNAESQPLEPTIDPDACGGKCCRTKDGWDGTRNGKKLAPQVFVYYLEATFEGGEAITRKGNITLVR